jgi:hypothetical protein
LDQKAVTLRLRSYGDAVPVKFTERATARIVRPHRGNHCLEKVI